MYDLLAHNRLSMQFQTELLEACDWDEEVMDSLLKKVSNLLESLRVPDLPCSLDFYLEKTVKSTFMKENISEIHTDIIINYIKHNASFIKWMMSVE
tara:strand:- start:240 stop:527 length:288 start_codon:yes stop_codon:yes gene_type:complete